MTQARDSCTGHGFRPGCATVRLYALARHGQFLQCSLYACARGWFAAAGVYATYGSRTEFRVLVRHLRFVDLLEPGCNSSALCGGGTHLGPTGERTGLAQTPARTTGVRIGEQRHAAGGRGLAVLSADLADRSKKTAAAAAAAAAAELWLGRRSRFRRRRSGGRSWWRMGRTAKRAPTSTRQRENQPEIISCVWPAPTKRLCVPLWHAQGKQTCPASGPSAAHLLSPRRRWGSTRGRWCGAF